jgi:hypothetical protein
MNERGFAFLHLRIRVFVFGSLRSLTPLTGGATATGATPGVGVIRVDGVGRSGTLVGLDSWDRVRRPRPRSRPQGDRGRLGGGLLRRLPAPARLAGSPDSGRRSAQVRLTGAT